MNIFPPKSVPAHMLNIRDLQHLCHRLKIPPEELDYLINNSCSQFTPFQKTINEKSRNLVRVTERLTRPLTELNHILQKLDFPSFYHGGIKGRSVKTNAKSHLRSRYVLATDLKDFFPSISTGMVRATFQNTTIP